VKGVLLFEVLREGSVEVIPGSEGMDLAPELLAPVTGGVDGEGNSG
jgi:hypothetical protein